MMNMLYGMNEWMNEYFIMKEQNCVDWTEKLKEHLQLP